MGEDLLEHFFSFEGGHGVFQVADLFFIYQSFVFLDDGTEQIPESIPLPSNLGSLVLRMEE